MKEYDCPDCERTDSCEGCHRVILKNAVTTTTTPYGYKMWEDYRKANDFNCVPDTCKRCSNHPINGGSGICHCTLGSATIY
jgi:hypothetical protein